MPWEIEATYENGVLKPDQPLPLAEQQRVKVVVEPKQAIAEQLYGHMGWTGDPKVVRKIALDPEFGVVEAP